MLFSLCFGVYFRNWNQCLDCIFSKNSGELYSLNIHKVGQNKPQHNAYPTFVHQRYGREMFIQAGRKENIMIMV